MFCGPPQIVKDHARFNTRYLSVGVQVQDLIHVAAHIDHDGHIAGLAGQAGAGTAG
jgi:transketolase C-terminal domain/subunit